MASGALRDSDEEVRRQMPVRKRHRAGGGSPASGLFPTPGKEKCSDDSGGESRNQKSGNQPAHGGQNIIALPKKQSGPRIKRSRYGNRLHVTILLIGYVGDLVRKEPVAEKAMQASFAQVFA